MRSFLIIVREIMVTLLIFSVLTGGVIFTTLKRNGKDKMVMEKIKVQLGDVAKDTITGFKGVVVGVTKWLHGCERIVTGDPAPELTRRAEPGRGR